MLKTAFRIIQFSLIFSGFSSLDTLASWKNVKCPVANNEMGVEAFMLVTSGIKFGHEKKCVTNYKYFDVSEIDLSDSNDFKKITAKDVSATIKKISPSGIVFYEVKYKDEKNNAQEMTITITTRTVADDGSVDDEPCASVLSSFPSNLVRINCI